MQSATNFPDWHGTTILAVRKNGKTVVAGDAYNIMIAYAIGCYGA